LTTHRERIEICLSGEKPDRTPVALWRHFPVDDQDPYKLASAIIAFQEQFDFDLVKITPASSFSIKDWGARDSWKGNPEGTRDYLSPVIKKQEDWLNLTVLNPKNGSLSDQLVCLSLLTKHYSSRAVPVLQTVFSPISQAKNLVGKGNLLSHLHSSHPDFLLKGLQTITKSTVRFIEECKKIGADGFFYAMQFAQTDVISIAEFDQLFRPFDSQILSAMADSWIRIGHLHGDNVMFDQITNYPVNILNWHDRQTAPDLATSLLKFPGVVCGGIRQWDTLVFGTDKKVTIEAKDAIHQTDGRRFILSTGCVAPIIAPYGNILAARQSVEL
jgi:uroporphyrinogen decarboxylase